jgi:UDP-N-acetylmuramoyl-L-alanyl-D-glutamate--2,6-diaminopimelate ligase
LQFADIIRQMPDFVALPPHAAQAWQLAAQQGGNLLGITADSRAVRHGMIFAALPGSHADGRNFIASAVARGASAVLAPLGTDWPAGVPVRPLLADPEPRRRMALIAALFAGPMPTTLVAVTGTNGKTSTVEFTRQLWALSGRAAASLGTLGVIGPGLQPGPGLTTPDPVALSHALATAKRAGIEHVAVEASSHGLDQFRLDGLRLTAGAFTNLTRDHLDYHGTMAAYRDAKLRLFQALLPPRAPVVASTALDADSLAGLREIARRRRHALVLVGEGGTGIDLLRAVPVAGGQILELSIDGTGHEILLKLPGRFQADNALVAAALARATGAPDALASLGGLVGVRGRMELAATLPNGAAVYVDFAHTPDALTRLLQALRPHASGRLHIVFGAGGDRDPGKRPLMGHAVAAADRIVVTDDNPRSENPAAIRAAILAACPGAVEITDRAAAIAAAMSDLGPNDVLVIAGKGHEQGQTIGATTLPFDDAAVVRALAGAA